jgi:hypothetical protein
MPTVCLVCRAVSILLLPLLAACSVAPSSPTARHVPPPAASQDIYQAALVWDDVVAAGCRIRGWAQPVCRQPRLPASIGKYCRVWTRLLVRYRRCRFRFGHLLRRCDDVGNCGAAKQMFLFLDSRTPPRPVLASFQHAGIVDHRTGETRLRLPGSASEWGLRPRFDNRWAARAWRARPACRTSVAPVSGGWVARQPHGGVPLSVRGQGCRYQVRLLPFR